MMTASPETILATVESTSMVLANKRIRRLRLEDRLDGSVKKRKEKKEDLFTELYREYYPIGIQLVYKMERDCPYAEDIVQDVFVKLFKHRDKLLHVESFSGYFFFCVRNRYISFQCRQNKYRVIELNEDVINRQTDMVAPADEKIRLCQAEQIIELAIASQPPQRQKVFRMNRIEEMKHKEIAEVLHIHPVTVAAYIMKAVSILQPQLSQELA